MEDPSVQSRQQSPLGFVFQVISENQNSCSNIVHLLHKKGHRRALLRKREWLYQRTAMAPTLIAMQLRIFCIFYIYLAMKQGDLCASCIVYMYSIDYMH